MFRPFRSNASPFDREIERLLTEMHDQETTSEKYAAALDKLAKVHKMKADDSRDRVRMDTYVTAGASLIGIVLILHYEQLHPITTKALPFVPKAK
jgi:hypothetical protein